MFTPVREHSAALPEADLHVFRANDALERDPAGRGASG
jgi:hypothetical protein